MSVAYVLVHTSPESIASYLSLQTCTLLRPVASGSEAKSLLDVSFSVSSPVTLSITDFAVTLASIPFGNSFGLQEFRDEDSVPIAQFATTLNGSTISTYGNFGLSLAPDHIYTFVAAENPALTNLPMPPTP